MHLVIWESLNKSKDLGGLGIKNMSQLNQALLGKLGIWKLVCLKRVKCYTWLALRRKEGVGTCLPKKNVISVLKFKIPSRIYLGTV
ncbi:hypothetical protein V2J09_022320 [Rumex salicifolius]